jgi:hypothetical protein
MYCPAASVEGGSTSGIEEFAVRDVRLHASAVRYGGMSSP